MQPHRLAGAHHVLVGHVLLAVDDVLAHGTFEQPGILQHHAEKVVDIFAGEFARGDAVDADAAAVQLVKAHQQVDHGGLAGACRADDGDLLPRMRDGRKVVDDDLAGVVAEADVLERHLALHLFGRKVRRFAAFVGKFPFR